MGVTEAPVQLETDRRIQLPPSLAVKQLADLMGVNVVDIIKQLMRNGIMAASTSGAMRVVALLSM